VLKTIKIKIPECRGCPMVSREDTYPRQQSVYEAATFFTNVDGQRFRRAHGPRGRKELEEDDLAWSTHVHEHPEGLQIPMEPAQETWDSRLS
jgi:hypothetical protein